MSVKYTLLKQAARAMNFQKIMAQPYEKLQKTFRTASAQPNIPALHDPALTVGTQQVCGQPVLFVRHNQPTDKVCVYVVGGGMLKYPKPAQAKEQLDLAKATGRDMVLPYYPLVPHSLLDVYDMLYAVYKLLLQRYKPENIAFLGGSSGGNHTLGLMSHIHAKGEGLPMPGRVYVSSPGTMLCTEAERCRAALLDKTDLIMSRRALETIFDGMAAGRDVPEYMRYLQKGDYTGLPSAYLCFGGDEVFSAAAESIRNRLQDCVVDVTLEVGAGMFHCYSAMPLVPEAAPAHQRMIDYLHA